MRIAELIDLLKTYPPETKVFVTGYEYGVHELVRDFIWRGKAEPNDMPAVMGGPFDFDTTGKDQSDLLITNNAY